MRLDKQLLHGHDVAMTRCISDAHLKIRGVRREPLADEGTESLVRGSPTDPLPFFVEERTAPSYPLSDGACQRFLEPVLAGEVQQLECVQQTTHWDPPADVFVGDSLIPVAHSLQV